GIMQDKRYALMEAGPTANITETEFCEAIEAGAVTGVEIFPLDDKSFPLDVTLGKKDETGLLRGPAFVIYLSAEAVELLPDSVDEYISKKAEAKKVTIPGNESFDSFYFWLVSSSHVQAVLKQLCMHAKDALIEHLTWRLGDDRKSKISRRDDKADVLCDVWRVLSWDRQSAEESIVYAGFVMLLGPDARNYRFWLNTALRGAGIKSIGADFWKEKSYGVFDEIESRIKISLWVQRILKIERPDSGEYLKDQVRNTPDNVVELNPSTKQSVSI
ncbi:MAG: hypothetical protein L3K26_10905, partial [Candidatus Hydrogenedentes bacterium]|nr:hypothetical protein [Candidatus Hydrogenedentota bacterium]